MSNNKKLKRNRRVRYKNTHKLTNHIKISQDYLHDTKLRIGTVNDDYLQGLLTARLDGLIIARTLKTKQITFKFKRPTFFEWLFRKDRIAVVEFDVEEMLSKDVKSTMKLYNAKLKEV